MAIAFCRIGFENITDGWNAASLLAYLGRTTRASVLGRADFSDLPRDLVYEEALPPYAAPPGFLDPDIVARVIDEVEGRRFRTLEGRSRYPQFAAHAVLALPPESEMALVDAVEICRRFIFRLREDRDLPFYFAVHDASVIPGKSYLRNRHAHIVAMLRETSGNSLSRRRARDVVGPIRKNAQGKNRRPEIDRWPDLAWALTTEMFSELGSPIRVDPISPNPARHLSAEEDEVDPNKLARLQDRQFDENRRAVLGDPLELVRSLLRGRATLQIGDLVRAIDKWAPESEAARCLDRVLVCSEVVTLANGEKPTHLTTKAIFKRLQKIATIVRRAKGAEGRHWSETMVRCTREMSRQSVLSCIEAMLAEGPTDGSDIDAYWILDEHLSSVENIWNESQFPVEVEKHTISSALKREDWSPALAVVCPHSERLDDQILIELILKCSETRCSLILGFDVSRALGTTLNCLAAFLSASLAPRGSPCPWSEPTPDWAEALLRAGQIDAGLRELEDRRAIEYGWDGERPALENLITVSCEYARRLPPAIAQSIEESLPTLAPGDRVLVTRTDFSVRPPILCEGDSATVWEVDSEGRGLVETEYGNLVQIDFRTTPVKLMGPSILLAEARRRVDLPMRIELTDAARAFGAVLVAARAAAVHGADTKVLVHSSISNSRAELVQVISNSFSAPFLTRTSMPPKNEVDEKKRENPAPDQRRKVSPALLREFKGRNRPDIRLMEEITSSKSAMAGFMALTSACKSTDFDTVEKVNELRQKSASGGLLIALIDIITEPRNVVPNLNENEQHQIGYTASKLGTDCSAEDRSGLIQDLSALHSYFSRKLEPTRAIVIDDPEDGHGPAM